MSNTQDKTCAGRIQDNLHARLSDFSAFRTVLETDEPHETDPDTFGEDADSAYERINEYPLALSTFIVKRLELSTGGPADWLEYFIAPEDDSIYRIVYHFSDWFDHAEKTLDGAEFESAEQFAYDLGIVEQ